MANTEYVEAHLKPMGLSAAKHASEEVTIENDVDFGDDPSGLPFPVHVVKTKSLNDIKAWIGNADDDSGHVDQASEMDFSAVSVDTEDLSELATAARHHVYQNSAAVAHLVPAIENALGPFDVMVLAADVIKIAPGTTLTYSGQIPKVVVAKELIFEGAGSQIDSFVHLKMTVDSVDVKS